MTIDNDDILDCQKQMLRLEMSQRRMLISSQFAADANSKTGNTTNFPRSFTMRLLQTRPDVALQLLSKLTMLIVGKKALKKQPVINKILSILPLLIKYYPLFSSLVSSQKTNQTIKPDPFE